VRNKNLRDDSAVDQRWIALGGIIVGRLVVRVSAPLQMKRGGDRQEEVYDADLRSRSAKQAKRTRQEVGGTGVDQAGFGKRCFRH
jgi:hypothetical protein